ncbi:hypothetical protein [Shinella sp.]|uniref:hypothetical protein n=1 Tax=Shinella sp. TaxID=1870904 RepID=UPI0029BC7390|nr:hypothetical protein [Shinella sp.]MDX3977022.1 hypothetical protein [Shinella sp.]
MRSVAIERFRRAELEACIEELIALLDTMDEDCDLEDGADAEPSFCSRPFIVNGRAEYDLEDDPAESGVADEEALWLMGCQA